MLIYVYISIHYTVLMYLYFNRIVLKSVILIYLKQLGYILFKHIKCVIRFHIKRLYGLNRVPRVNPFTFTYD